MTAIAASSRCIRTSCSASSTSTSRTILDEYKDRKGYTLDTDLDAPTTGRARREVQGDGRGELGKPFPQDPQRAALGRDRRRVRLLDEPARHQLSRAERHSRELGHCRQRAGDGVRQSGRDRGHRRRLHAQSVDRREGALRRVPHQRAGRRRGRRHPHAADITEERAHRGELRQAVDGDGDARGLSPSSSRIYGLLEKHYRDMQDFEFTIERGKLWMLQTRNGKRTARRRCDRRRYGRARA